MIPPTVNALPSAHAGLMFALMQTHPHTRAVPMRILAYAWLEQAYPHARPTPAYADLVRHILSTLAP